MKKTLLLIGVVGTLVVSTIGYENWTELNTLKAGAEISMVNAGRLEGMYSQALVDRTNILTARK